jgi:hypothetical protein
MESSMADIKIEKYQRDCPHNTQLIGVKGARLIYDFRVIIDGEYRAEIRGGAINKDYGLYDTARRPIYIRGNNAVIGRKRDLVLFQQTIEKLLHEDKIPTLDEIATYRAGLVQQREAAYVASQEHARIERIQWAAVDLYEALKAMMQALRSANAPLGASQPEGWADDDTMDHMPGVKQARLALAKAESRQHDPHHAPSEIMQAGPIAPM